MLSSELPCSIYEAIGRGKHSVVYKGRKKKSIQYYAIKSVEKTQKPRVLQEVRLTLVEITQMFAFAHMQCLRDCCAGPYHACPGAQQRAEVLCMVRGSSNTACNSNACIPVCLVPHYSNLAFPATCLSHRHIF